MKKILIITPYFPPSNLAGVHRSRLFAQHLPSFGWKPIILTVQEKYYEEALDPHLEKLLPENLQVEKVKALPVTKPRLIGDIGIRSFFQLYRRAKQVIKDEKIDFIYIPIPSFYPALLGRLLHRATKVPYGIDYIDPWVHQFPGSDKVFSRHWLSMQVAKFLEPIAVKKASLITGVAEGYYLGVQERNPHLLKQAVFGAMPYGGEKADHDKVKALGVKPYLFSKKEGKVQLIYAGAMLPKAYQPLEAILAAIKKNAGIFIDLEIHFIGTGKTPNDPNGFNIRPIAEKYGLWESVIFEYPARIPYLDVLIHLEACSGVFVLGSTEPHYTPSKVYQGILSKKPVLAVLHSQSTAVNVVVESKAGVVLDFNGEEEIEKVGSLFSSKYQEYLQFALTYNHEKIKWDELEKYSAYEVTSRLVSLLNSINLS